MASRSIPSRGPNGTLYVAANNNHTIESFDAASGAPISSFGSGPGQRPQPRGGLLRKHLRRQLRRKSRRVRPQRRMRQRMQPIDTSRIPDGRHRPRQRSPLCRLGTARSPSTRRAVPTPAITFGQGKIYCGLIFGTAVNATSGRVYVTDFYRPPSTIFDPGADRAGSHDRPGDQPGHRPSGTLTGHVDPEGGGEVTACHFEYGTDTSYSRGSRSLRTRGADIRPQRKFMPISAASPPRPPTTTACRRQRQWLQRGPGPHRTPRTR